MVIEPSRAVTLFTNGLVHLFPRRITARRARQRRGSHLAEMSGHERCLARRPYTNLLFAMQRAGVAAATERDFSRAERDRGDDSRGVAQTAAVFKNKREY